MPTSTAPFDDEVDDVRGPDEHHREVALLHVGVQLALVRVLDLQACLLQDLDRVSRSASPCSARPISMSLAHL